MLGQPFSRLPKFNPFQSSFVSIHASLSYFCVSFMLFNSLTLKWLLQCFILLFGQLHYFAWHSPSNQNFENIPRLLSQLRTSIFLIYLFPIFVRSVNEGKRSIKLESQSTTQILRDGFLDINNVVFFSIAWKTARRTSQFVFELSIPHNFKNMFKDVFILKSPNK